MNVDPALIEKVVNDIRRGEYTEVHSILLFKDGKLVFEEYFEGHEFEYEAPGHHGGQVMFERSMPHEVMSVTKSITSICIGIAVDKGFIERVDQSIFDYLPDYRHLATDGKEEITIEHLLAMISGLDWNEWAIPYANRNNDAIAIYFTEDPVEYGLGKSMISEPGKSFNYVRPKGVWIMPWQKWISRNKYENVLLNRAVNIFIFARLKRQEVLIF